jgi:WD40 repeat protein
LNDTNEVWAIAISPDGQTLALGGKEGEIKIWNLYDLSLVNVLSAHRGGVIDLTFSPNGRMLFSSGVDSSVKVWQLDR